MVTKKQIVNAVVKFVENDMMKSAGSGSSKFLAVLGKNALKKNPAIIDNVLENPLVKEVIAEDNGMYDIDSAAEMLKKTMEEAGALPLQLPKIPLVLPEGDEIRLDRTDIDRLLSYMQEDEPHTKKVEVEDD